MSFKLITSEADIQPMDIVREPQEKRLYKILDIDVTFGRLLLQYHVTDHISDEDRKILVYWDALINKWEKMVSGF
ncbi:MAG: hypothetical protein ACK4ND_04390 [Cytophagaceae bacterium]